MVFGQLENFERFDLIRVIGLEPTLPTFNASVLALRSSIYTTHEPPTIKLEYIKK